MNKQILIRFLTFFLLLSAFYGCNDEYLYLNEAPERLGASIYSTLTSDPRFKTYVQMLQRADSSYIQVLDRTGSRTLFVPDDEAFNRFFQDNPYGYKKVDDMPISLIKSFLRFYTLENAYISSVLGNAPGPEVGGCLRRYTTYERTDSIPYTDKFPDNPQFAKFKGGKMYLTTPGDWTLIHFTPSYLQLTGMKGDDYSLLYPGLPWNANDISVFDAKVTERDIVNTNGYIHVLDKVVLPPQNMYEYIRDKAGTGIFKKLIERFCEPVYDAEATQSLWDRNPGVRDSVYNISFFYTGDRYVLDNYGNRIKVDNLLFSPSNNGVQNIRGTVENIGQPPREMPVIFVPTDEAMEKYLKESFFSSYGSWDNVPDNIVVKFINTHTKRLFSDSYPSRLSAIVDDVKGDPMFSDFNYNDIIGDAQVCRNGVVYTVNTVVAPRDFSTVVAPIMNDDRTRIVNWIINTDYNNRILKYNYYLTSLENSFTLFVPVDDAFKNYLDPINQADNITGGKKGLTFKYIEDLKGVTYHYCDVNGDSIGPLVDKPEFSVESDPVLKIVQNRLRDIMDYHIVVGEINDNQTFVRTKGGTYFKVDRQGGKMRIQGAGDIEAGTYVNILEKIDVNNGVRNGTVYIIDKRIDHTLKSGYTYLRDLDSNNSIFYEQLDKYNVPDNTFFGDTLVFETEVKRLKQQEYYKPVFFAKDGINLVFPFLGSFDYTIFAPTNDAMERAFNAGLLKRDTEIAAITNENEKIEEIKKAIRFLKNHFVDRSIFTKQFYNENDPKSVEDYQFPSVFSTAAKDPGAKMFYSITIDKAGEGFVIKNNNYDDAKTVGVTDALTRQYRFTGSGTSATIGSNSRAVIHRIDRVIVPPSN
jgi:uncharacterized surface protein with fasciclin (FAS1) repeats